MLKPIKKVIKHPDRTEIIYELPGGMLHREDGPVYILEYDNGDYNEFWYLNDKPHRYGGPAFIFPNKKEEYYIHGKSVINEVNAWLSEQNYVWNTMSDIEKWELELFMRSLG